MIHDKYLKNLALINQAQVLYVYSLVQIIPER